MKNLTRIGLAFFVFALVACAAPTQLAKVQPTAQVTACVTVGPSNSGIIQECISNYITATPTATVTATSTDTPTLTATATATSTSTPVPSATAAPTSAIVLVPWHAPGSHLDPITHLPLGIHEHGDAPPSWVAGATCVPFSQFREGHIFYKGMYATDRGGKGVESYIIIHVATTVAARAHGDHDYMVFFKTPGTNFVSCAQGLLDFGSPPPLVTLTVDPGTRPIILSKNDGHTPNADCETWYSAPGRLVFDLGWTICNRWTRLDGSADGGNGTHRGADWHVYINRFAEWPGMDPNLAKYAVDDGFNHLRLDFVRNDVQFPDAGVTGPN